MLQYILVCCGCLHSVWVAVKDNSRHDSLHFDIDLDTVLHGFGGYFYCVLYADIAFSASQIRDLSCLSSCNYRCCFVYLLCSNSGNGSGSRRRRRIA